MIMEPICRFGFLESKLRRTAFQHSAEASPDCWTSSRWIFYFHGFCGDADDDVIGLDVARDHRAGTDQRVVADLHAGQNGRVIGEANAVSDPRVRCLDLVNVVDVMVVGVDVCVVRDRDVVADVDAAAIVEQYVPMDDDVVSEREVVAKRPLDKVPAFEVVANAAKDHRREHAAETVSEQ